VKAIHNLLSLVIVCANLSVSYISPAVAESTTKLAVVNKAGEVWVREVWANAVGEGVKLEGPGLFGGPDDAFVLGSYRAISVVTKSGVLWVHSIEGDAPGEYLGSILGSVYPVAGSLFGGPDAKYVLTDSNMIYVINTKGEVWAHPWTANLSDGYKLSGPSLFGSPNDKYVLLDGNRILVINTLGEIWAHDLSCTHPIPQSYNCPPDTIGGGYKLNGPNLFGAANDKYVVLWYDLLFVINTSGEVWARQISSSTVGAGYKLSGPALFGGANDKYVVVYEVPILN
jgi:hypothetical protein